jgi:hypothetical protein
MTPKTVSTPAASSVSSTAWPPLRSCWSDMRAGYPAR